jgi:hypothetical protein
VSEKAATDQLLERLQARLDRAVARAEQAIAEADLDPIFERGRELRRSLPPEVGDHLTEALRHFLLAQRALVDWLLARLEARRTRHAAAAERHPEGP